MRAYPLIRRKWSSEHIMAMLFVVILLYLVPRWITNPLEVPVFIAALAIALIIDAAAGFLQYKRLVCSVSAAVTTGVLQVLTPGIPLWGRLIGITAAIVLGKTVWGGTGKNILNPAIVGYLAIYLIFSASYAPITSTILLLPALVLSLPFLFIRPFASIGLMTGMALSILMVLPSTDFMTLLVNCLFFGSIVITDPVTTTRRKLPGLIVAFTVGFVPLMMKNSALNLAMSILIFNLLSYLIDDFSYKPARCLHYTGPTIKSPLKEIDYSTPALDLTAMDRADLDQTALDQTALDQKVSDRTALDQKVSDMYRTDLDRTTLDRTTLNRTAINQTVSDWTILDRTASDRTTLDRTTLNRTALDRTASDRSTINQTALHLTTAYSETCADLCNLSEGLTPEQILEKIEDREVYGCGGAAFPTAEKIRRVFESSIDKKYLIINGVECDPGLIHDKWLLFNRASDILQGIRAISSCIRFSNVILAVKDTAGLKFPGDITVHQVKNYYPAGFEKLLIKSCLGIVLPDGTIPSNAGLLVLNIQTVLMLYEAVFLGKKATEKYITVSDMKSGKAAVVKVRTGDNILKILSAVYPGKQPVFTGGGAMFAHMADETSEIEMETNFIAVSNSPRYKESLFCSGCGSCEANCPQGLRICKISELINEEKFEEVGRYNPEKCIKCGICSYICPGGRNLSARMAEAKEAVLKYDEGSQGSSLM